MLLPPARVCEIGRAVDVPQRRIALTICAVTPRAVLNEKLCRIHLARRRSLTCSCVCAKKISAEKNECRRQHGQLQKPSHFSNQRSIISILDFRFWIKELASGLNLIGNLPLQSAFQSKIQNLKSLLSFAVRARVQIVHVEEYAFVAHLRVTTKKLIRQRQLRRVFLLIREDARFAPRLVVHTKFFVDEHKVVVCACVLRVNCQDSFVSIARLRVIAPYLAKLSQLLKRYAVARESP